MEVVANLRELGDSLRSNAARLLRDVQAIHSNMLERIDRVDPERASLARARGASISAPASGRSAMTDREARGRRSPAYPEDGGDLQVPEFIPPG
jgi:hypothetical protein